jgi:hypothetical protein
MRLRNPLLLFLAAAFLLAAAERPFARVEGDALTSHTFQLHYRENFGLAFLHIRILSHPNAFPKEPPLGNAEVFRGIICLPKHSGPSIPLIGDKTQRRLYVDRNRNGDLTDDPSFQAKGEKDVLCQYFENVVIASPQGPEAGLWNVTVLLSKPGSTGRDPDAGYVQSAWVGEVNLHGNKWQMAIQDDLDGQITPRDKMFVVEPGFFDVEREPNALMNILSREALSPMRKIWLDGESYDLSFRLGPGEKGGVLNAVFTESPSPAQECEIAGTGIAQLLLKSAGSDKDQPGTLALFRKPGRTIRVPPGEYYARVYLDGGPDLGMAWFDGFNSKQTFRIGPGASAVLNLGGPLKPTLYAQRTRSNLSMTYSLEGVGKDRYDFLRKTEIAVPKVTIYKGNRQIAAGNFNFG